MIYLSKPYFDQEEIQAIEEVLKSGWVAGQGPKNAELAEVLKIETNTKFAIPVNNCTAALHLSLLAINIKPSDEVLVSDFTFPATGHAVMYCGAKPVFVDSDIQTYNFDVTDAEKKITSKTKALIVVHALGQMADMDKIISFASRYNLKIIEDAACAFGACYKGKPAGSFGHITTFSFHARKNITSGEGGAIVTNNEKYAAICSSLSCFGMESAYKRQNGLKIPSFEQLGYNYKLSDINAAIALVQIKKYNKMLNKRFKSVELYNKLLSNQKYLKIPFQPGYSKHIYQTYAILLDDKIDRDKIITSLKKEEIQSQIGTYASHIQPVYNSIDTCPVSLKLYKQTLALPLYYDLTDNEIYTVVEKLNYYINHE